MAEPHGPGGRPPRIGMIGLGRMGGAMAARLVADGVAVTGFDRDPAARRQLRHAGGTDVEDLPGLVGTLDPPRVAWLMLPAGDAVDATLQALTPLLAAGDVVVDGGNSFYKDTRRRAERLEQDDIALVDAGVSGGVGGRRHGWCLMVGGDPDAVERVAPALERLAPPDGAWARVGPVGAGHFVKMVHNGIEYGLMQAYAEGFALLEGRRDMQLDLARVARLWCRGSVVRSWLLELVAGLLERDDGLEDVAARVSDSGAGRWTVAEAVEQDVPAPVITLALLERLSSRRDDAYAHRLLAALRGEFGGHAVPRAPGADGA